MLALVPLRSVARDAGVGAGVVISLVAWLLFAIAILVIGIIVLRKSRRSPDPRQRTQVPAVVVRRTGLIGLPALDVQYAAPDGRTHTGRVKTGFTRHALLTDGQRTTVWIVPDEPWDVVLDPSGGTKPLPFFAGIVVIVLGGVQTLMATAFLVLMLVAG